MITLIDLSSIYSWSSINLCQLEMSCYMLCRGSMHFSLCSLDLIDHVCIDFGWALHQSSEGGRIWRGRIGIVCPMGLHVGNAFSLNGLGEEWNFIDESRGEGRVCVCVYLYFCNDTVYRATIYHNTKHVCH